MILGALLLKLDHRRTDPASHGVSLCVPLCLLSVRRSVSLTSLYFLRSGSILHTYVVWRDVTARTPAPNRRTLRTFKTDTWPVFVIGDYSPRGVFAQIIAKSHSSSGTGFLFCPGNVLPDSLQIYPPSLLEPAHIPKSTACVWSAKLYRLSEFDLTRQPCQKRRLRSRRIFSDT